MAVPKHKHSPSALTPQRLQNILSDIASGGAIHKVLKKYHVCKSVFYLAVNRNPDLAERYARSRMAGLDAIADEAIAIADDGRLDPQDRRVRIDTRKWLLAVYNPRKYSPRTLLTGDQDNPVSISLEGIRSKLIPELAADDAPPALEQPDGIGSAGTRPRLALLGKT